MVLNFITGNKNKLKEAREILGEVEGLDIDLPEIQEIDPHKIIQAKLKAAFEYHDGPFLVEDTSLYFEAMNGLPGPLIKWFLKTVDNEGLYKIAGSFENKKATAKTVIGCAKNREEVKFFEGIVSGEIVAPRGEGFGWDPVFQPNGYDKTFGEMSADEKNQISMRKKSFENLTESDFFANF